jgi:outer membrane protein assembly factor BamB
MNTNNSRPIVTVILAVVLIIIVMGVAAFFAWTGLADNTKFVSQAIWSQTYAETQTMKVMSASDKQKIVVVQNLSNLSSLDANGKTLFKRDFTSPLVTTFGDVNGDNQDDIIVASVGQGGVAVTLLDLKGEVWRVLTVKNMTRPERVSLIRFAGNPQIIVGDNVGKLAALKLDGTEVWRAELKHGGATDVIRGLDEVKVDGGVYLAAANHDGQVAVYDATGKPRWTWWLGSTLRRLRGFDLRGDGKGQVVVGGDNSRAVLLDANTGKEVWGFSVGGAVTEAREVENDGDPKSRELIIGTKSGGVIAVSVDGVQLWSATVDEKVNEIAGVDVDGDGIDEVIVGDDAGNVALFKGKGIRASLASHSSAISRIDAEKVTQADQIVVTDASKVTLLSLKKETAPIWYNPLLAGVIVSIVIAGAAWFIATIPPKPVLRAEATDQSAEGLQSRLRMLHESIADVERLRQAGEMAPEAYTDRLRELRGELANTEAALLKVGVKIRPETSKCPNCGGALPLGIDKCDYCGAVVIA